MKLFKSASKATLLVLLLFPVFTFAGLPDPGMTITQGRTALVLTHNALLSLLIVKIYVDMSEIASRRSV